MKNIHYLFSGVTQDWWLSVVETTGSANISATLNDRFRLRSMTDFLVFA